MILVGCSASKPEQKSLTCDEFNDSVKNLSERSSIEINSVLSMLEELANETCHNKITCDNKTYCVPPKTLSKRPTCEEFYETSKNILENLEISNFKSCVDSLTCDNKTYCLIWKD